MLSNKNLVIIGGGAGIGLAVARLAVSKGMRVVAASPSAPDRLAALDEFKGKSIRALSFDITRKKDHERLLEEAGGIDHLVVAVRPKLSHAPFMDADADQARRAWEVKFWGAWSLIRAARSAIRENGSITLTSGIAGEKIYPGHTPMAVINSAVETLCRALAVELAPVRVNAVSPGFVAPKPAGVQKKRKAIPPGPPGQGGRAGRRLPRPYGRHLPDRQRRGFRRRRAPDLSRNRPCPQIWRRRIGTGRRRKGSFRGGVSIRTPPRPAFLPRRSGSVEIPSRCGTIVPPQYRPAPPCFKTFQHVSFLFQL